MNLRTLPRHGEVRGSSHPRNRQHYLLSGNNTYALSASDRGVAVTNWLAARPAGLHVGTAASPAEPADVPRTWEFVHAAQEGDSTAFGELYDRYVDTVYRYVYFRLGDRDLA